MITKKITKKITTTVALPISQALQVTCHMLDDLGNHLCDENGNRFKFYE